MNYDMDFYYTDWKETQRLVASAQNLLSEAVRKLNYLSRQHDFDDFDGFAWESSLDLYDISNCLADVVDIAELGKAFASSITQFKI
jgi:hypothetical protein